MKKLFFTSLRIRKAPGFRDGLNVHGFTNFSSGINIIAGPNGAGKSTTARTIIDLLWPDRKDKTGLDASADFDLDGEKWSEHLSSTELKVQQEGTDSRLPERPSENSSKVYMLALHELVNDTDGDLAEKIVEETMGGVNLDKAGENLNFTSTLKNKGSDDYRKFKKASEDFRKIESEHAGLESRDKELSDLKRRKTDAVNAKEEKDFYTLANELISADEEVNKSTNKLKEFPQVLASLKGDEVSTIEQLEGKIEEENREILRKEEIIRKREAVITNLNLPNDGSVQRIIDQISEYSASIKENERRITSITCELENLILIESVEREKIGKTADQEKLRNIRITQMGELEDYFRKAFNLAEKEIRLSNEISDIEEVTGSRESKTTELSKQIFETRSKITADIRKGIPAWLLVLVALLGILTSIATLLAGKPGLAGIILILAVSITGLYAYMKNNSGEGDDSGIMKLEELEKEFTAEMSRDEKLSRKNYLGGEQKKIRAAIDELNKDKHTLFEELGAMPGLTCSMDETDSGLFQFLNHLNKWQKAFLDLEGKNAEKAGYEKMIKDDVSGCNKLLEILHIEPITGSNALFAVCKELAQREASRKDSLKDIDIAGGQIIDCVNRMHEHVLYLKNIYEKLEIPFAERESARNLISGFNDFSVARDNDKDNRRILEERIERSSSHPLYSQFESEMSNWNHELLHKKISSSDELIAILETLTKDIADIEAEIKQKKNGNELETALSLKNRAKADLENLFDANLSSITGALILNQLKTENDKKNRPEVFKRADNLFNTITEGRYNLITNNEEKPRFLAFDNITREGFELDHLSTATRVQLLLSVRIAFIESLESDKIRLPLIADELLANSDEVRAEAIINALYLISSQGRQVFYFTAQEDEVIRWKNFMDSKKEKPDYRIINISSREYDKTVTQQQANVTMKFTFQAIQPEGMNIKEYREKLNIRPFDMLMDIPEQLPVAYITDDTSIVYNCLKKGIDSWGMLSSYCRNNGQIESLSDSILEKLSNKSILLSEYQELYRTGRPKRIDLDTLLESGSVSEKFVNQVKEMVEKAQGNPLELLKLLPSIPRIRKDSILDLEKFLKEKGYIDDSEPISDDQIRVRLQARISQLGLEPKEAEEFLMAVVQN